MAYRNDRYDPKQPVLLDQAALDDAVRRPRRPSRARRTSTR